MYGAQPKPARLLEIVSASTGARDRGIKRERYAPDYWVVDVDARRIERYAADREPEIGSATLTWKTNRGRPRSQVFRDRRVRMTRRSAFFCSSVSGGVV